MLKPMLRFAVSGGLATVIHVGVFVFLVEGFALRPVLAAAPAFVFALFVSYGMNYHWTFSASAPHRIMLPRFVVVALLGLVLNLGITYAVVDVAHYWYGYALLLVVLLVPLTTFLLSKFWVFNERDNG
ncbi:MAG: GtrA family protein [Gammaproteobacteria bacterium]|nr:GtrA family protein [Gammaproteobacteria bacterium]